MFLLFCGIFVILLLVIFCLNRRYALRYRITCFLFGTERERNQKHCYDFPSENNGWKKHGTSPVYGSKDTGSIFDPYVYKEDGDYIMCASERKTGSLIKLQSTDGIKWQRVSIMLSGVPNTWENIVNRGSVLHKEGKYFMWYTGQNGDSSSIGLAVSADGTSFTRVQLAPVLSPTLPLEGKSVMNPCVLWNEDKRLFQMWYSAGEAYEPDIICYAESVDGISWAKHRSPVLQKYPSHEWEKAKVGGCCVIREADSSYHMYYIGYQNIDVARICEVFSYDGIHWERKDNNLVLSPSQSSWDSHAVYKPSLIEENQTYYMWYNGRNGEEEYIGMATSSLTNIGNLCN